MESARGDLESLVGAARGGDREAFSELVRRFQDLAVATAWAWLGDPERARDAAQDAFLDAFLHLAELRAPAAFPGWLRRIVWKHCDRRTRRRRPAPADLAAGAAAPDPAPEAGDALDAAATRAWLRRAIEGLPAAERLAVALHYLAGEPQDAVAAFLDLPLSTVKGRLHSARARLRERSLEAMTIPDPVLRPSTSPAFRAGVELFLAVRARDRGALRALLDRHPELVDAHEDWSVDEALAEELPVPTRATPLIRAAEQGDVATIDLLLERGADVDGACRCAGREGPLFAALAAGRIEAARRPLEGGADATLRAFAGHTPLHVAAIRGLEAIVPELLARGADPAARSDAGETPLDWARRQGHEGVARLLEGAGGSGAGVARGPRPRSSARFAPEREVALFETGVKAIDLLAPLRRGDLVHWHAVAGVGRNVLLAELAHRALGSSARVLFALWERFAWEEGDFDAFLGETGLEGAVRVLRGSAADGGARPSLALEAIVAADAELARGAAHVLLAVFRREGKAAEVDAALPRLARSGSAAVTAFLLAPLREAAEREALALAPPFDAVLAFDPERARRRLFPALDPQATRSRHLEGLDVEHRRVALEARALLAEHAALGRELADAPLDALPRGVRERAARARRLESFLTQPFFVAESFSGRAGAHVSRAEAVAGAAAILAGELDATPAESLLYRGAL